MKHLLPYIALLCSAVACIYPYDPEVDDVPENVLAVEGEIIAGGVTSVRLGTLRPLWNENSSIGYGDYVYHTTPFKGARVWVEDEAGTTYAGTDPDNDGSVSIPMTSAPTDRKYRLCINALGESYVSDWIDILAPPTIRDVSFSIGDRDVVVGVSLDGGSGSTGYALLSYSETWEFHSDFWAEYVVDPTTWSISHRMGDYYFYWCWRTYNNPKTFPVDFSSLEGNGITGYPLLRFGRSDSRLHRKYSVNVTARTISAETYRYLTHLENISENTDDLFSPNPGELDGNLRCESDPDRMVLGYVTASATVSKRVFLGEGHFIATPVSEGSLVFPFEEEYGKYFSLDYLPLVENNGSRAGEGPFGWGSPRCYNCVAAGGTKEKPSFWE